MLLETPADIGRRRDDPLLDALGRAWSTFSQTYEVLGEPPRFATLFEGAQLARPYDAAETVLVNMLLDIVERVDRFSPRYALPAEAFGIVAGVGQPVRWRLTEQACRRWWALIDTLATVIEENHSVIRAMVLVDTLMLENPADEGCVSASCACVPPHTIQVRRSILNRHEILCDGCGQPFRLV